LGASKHGSADHLALFLGALSEELEFVEKIWGPLSYLTFPLSGAMFMVEWLPPTAQEVRALRAHGALR
jgi:ABC-type polysaccharide/polyol phosphate export permease